MRNMSFMLTTQQVLARTKTVTRRMGWASAKVGDIVQAVEKGQGLGKGGKINRLCLIRITGVRAEQLCRLTTDIWYGAAEVKLEGFPDMQPADFVTMFCQTHKDCKPRSIIRRIAFVYVDAVDTNKAAAEIALAIISGTNSEIEERAKAIFETQTKGWTGNAWDWDKAGDEVQERFRAHARAQTRPPLASEI